MRSIMFKKIFAVFMVFSLFGIALIPSSSAQEESESPFQIENGQFTYQGNVIDYKIEVSRNMKELTEGTPYYIPGAVDVIKVSDPFSAAGTPLVATITLENKGKSYPFNVIPLPPNQFGMLVSLDGTLTNLVCPNGEIVEDFYDRLTSFSKFMLFFKSISAVTNKALGQTCTYVELNWNEIPENVKQEALNRCDLGGDANENPTIRIWDCLKIVDMPYWNSEVSKSCPNGIDTNCVAKLNTAFSRSIGSSIIVALTDGERGECKRVIKTNVLGIVTKRPDEGETGDWWTGPKNNVVECGIGPDGLKVGERVSFDFIILVPADTPVGPLEGTPYSLQFDESFSQEYFTGKETGYYTESTSCLAESRFQKACHQINVQVSPMRVDTFLTSIGDFFSNIGDGLRCIFLPGGSYNKCKQESKGVDLVGDPIISASGIFFNFGPELGVTARLTIYLVWISAAAGTYALTRRFG